MVVYPNLGSLLQRSLWTLVLVCACYTGGILRWNQSEFAILNPMFRTWIESARVSVRWLGQLLCVALLCSRGTSFPRMTQPRTLPRTHSLSTNCLVWWLYKWFQDSPSSGSVHPPSTVFFGLFRQFSRFRYHPCLCHRLTSGRLTRWTRPRRPMSPSLTFLHLHHPTGSSLRRFLLPIPLQNPYRSL